MLDVSVLRMKVQDIKSACEDIDQDSKFESGIEETVAQLEQYIDLNS
jgi:hypothetical protein